MKQVEVEGGEIALKNSFGDIVIIPKKNRLEVERMIKDKCWNCIDAFVDTLPVIEDYAQDGSLIPKDDDKYKISYQPFTTQQDNTQTTAINQIIQIKERQFKEDKEKETYKKNYDAHEIESKKSTVNIDNVDMIGLKNLSKKDIKVIQKKLVDKKYLQSENTTLDIKNKDEVIKIQQLLKSKGYDLGKYGQNKDGIDGIAGKLTLTALKDYNENKVIDGIVGNKTIEAFKNYKLNSQTSKSNIYKKDIVDKDEKTIQKNLQKQGYFQAKDSDFNYNTDNILLKTESSKFKLNKENECTTKECSMYVGEQIENKIKTKNREQIGAYGDAWTIHKNLMSSGAISIYNALPDKKEISTNPEGYLNKKTDKVIPLKTKDLKSGDIVNMYYGGSKNIGKAYREGTSVWSTHLGIIKEDNEGNLFVEHNVSGKLYKEPVQNLLNNKAVTPDNKPLRITAITRPNYNLKDVEIYESTKTKINFNVVTNEKTSLGKKESAEFIQVLLNNKDVIQKDIPITNNEFNNLVKAAIVLGWKESNMTTDPKSELKNLSSLIRENIGGRESSLGYTQLKDKENLDESIRKNLNINNETLKNNKKSAIATMYALSTKYLKIKESLSPDIKMTEDELVQLAIISWNEPIDKVIQTANKYKTINKVRKAYQDSYGYDDKKRTLFPYDLTLEAFNKYIL